MKRLLAVVLLACAVATTAAAQPPFKRDSGARGNWHQHSHPPHYSPTPRVEPWVSFWGGVLGGWIAGQQANRPGREEEEVEGDLVPWSEAWFKSCKTRYRSFDEETGTYLSYSGERKFCK